MSLKYEKAVINSIIEDFSIVLCFLADILVFGLEFSVWQYLGSVIIVMVSVYVTITK